MPYFVVVNGAGEAWIDGRAMREQAGWSDHARFINRLTAEGMVLLGGPLPPTPRHRAMLIVYERDLGRARDRLAEDPWIRSRVLQLVSVEPWEILASNDRLDPVLAEIAGPHGRL